MATSRRDEKGEIGASVVYCCSETLLSWPWKSIQNGRGQVFRARMLCRQSTLNALEIPCVCRKFLTQDYNSILAAQSCKTWKVTGLSEPSWKVHCVFTVPKVRWTLLSANIRNVRSPFPLSMRNPFSLAQSASMMFFPAPVSGTACTAIRLARMPCRRWHAEPGCLKKAAGKVKDALLRTFRQTRLKSLERVPVSFKVSLPMIRFIRRSLMRWNSRR